MPDFQNKTVVVTGGAQGIGLGCCRAFADAGAAVYALDADAEALQELASQFHPIQCDVGRPNDVERACAQLPAKVDILINNAGISGEWKSVFETPVEEWDRVLGINLRAHWLMTKYVAPKMPAGSAIVNIASTRALMSEPNTEPYAASKGGIVALTHSLAISLADRRIRVNCISPGWIDVSRDKKSSMRNPEDIGKEAHEQHPAGRVGVPNDIAEACLYLCSPGAEFVTGANLVVDGGMTRKMIYVE